MSDIVEPKPKAASEDPKSLQNGLGLDALLAGPITKPAKPSSAKVEKIVEKVVEAKVKGAEPKGEAKAESKEEEADEKTDLATLKKQLKDTRDWSTKLKQTNTELQKSHAALAEKMKEVEAKLNGTYVEPTPIPLDQQVTVEKFKARVEVDNEAAIEKYGADVVQRLIWDADSPYMQLEVGDPAVMQRMQNAKRPVMEAMKIVEEHQFFEKYGRDPLRIEQAIAEKLRAELIADITKELKGQPIESVNNLSGVNGVSRAEQRKAPETGPKPDTSKIFTTFAPVPTA